LSEAIGAPDRFVAGSRGGETQGKGKSYAPAKKPEAVYDLMSLDGNKPYDARDLLASIIDADSLDEYKADYGKMLVTAYARVAGSPVGIVASQRLQVRTKRRHSNGRRHLSPDSADKAARFIMDCNRPVSHHFFQDVTGFMVARDAEQSGSSAAGRSWVNAVSNSTVPKITVVVGGSFGAGNYALCGKAYDPRFIPPGQMRVMPSWARPRLPTSHFQHSRASA
jgi:acetyl-CoA carboxylase carboxyltransferase component